MPELFPITSIGLPSLITDFGIQVTPRAPLFWLSDTVIPVSIVGAQVDITSKEVLRPQTWTSLGEADAPPANDLHADTGQLALGNHSFWIWISINFPTTSGGIAIEHRNAANSANIVAHIFQFQNSIAERNFQIGPFTLAMVLNERVRVINDTTMAAGETVSVSIFHRPE